MWLKSETSLPTGPLMVTVIFLILFTMVGLALAATGHATEVDWPEMGKGLFGGLALFLFGMEQISGALKSALGDQMKVLLAKLTRNRFTAVLTGTFVTAIVQSSSVTTVLVVGFVSAQMMTMAQSVGVIMGANIGSTITAQIVAFKVEEAALWMIAAGFLTVFIASRDRIRHYGNMLMGLGLIFYGMGLMGESMYPLRSYPPFLEMMTKMDSPFVAILVGAGFTALVQSSSATTAIVITMAGQGLISLEAGIALAFGANIGTCVTALLATLGKTRDAVRAASVHVIFNIVGVVIWLPFISFLAASVTAISPSHEALEGSARLAAEVPRQIANAHTIFNIANTLIFIAFTSQMASLVKWLIPDRPSDEKTIITPRYLNKSLLQTPSVALEAVRFEVARLGNIVAEMYESLYQGMVQGSTVKLADVRRKDDQVDVLEGEILRYLAEIRKQELTSSEGHQIALIMKAADLFESVGDVLETDLVEIGSRAIEKKVQLNDEMRLLVQKLGGKLALALMLTTRAIRDLDEKAALDVIHMKKDIDYLINEAFELQSKNLAAGQPDIEMTRMELTLFENFKRMHSYLKRIAIDVVPKDVRV